MDAASQSLVHLTGVAQPDCPPGPICRTHEYDCVTRIGERAAVPGTLLYCSPSRLEGRGTAPSDDIYALASSFFHVMFEKEPFQYEGVRAKERGLNWDGVERDEYSVLPAFLERATHPDPEERFATVAEALAVLRPPPRREGRPVGAATGKRDGDTGAEPPTPVHPGDEGSERRENVVPWLMSLLQSYPGSRWGNRETRGLDSDFAARTYVETKLEEALHRDIVERRVRLVVLCGNAGDGKTALLQHLARCLGLGSKTSATRILKGRLNSGLTVRMNLDGSASWKGCSADQLLDKFLAPFQQGPPSGDVVHLLAINDGRLLEWIEDVKERRGETPLTKDLLECLEGSAAPPESHIRFVSLNQRSLVGGVTADGQCIDTGFLDDLVDSLYDGEGATATWAPCQTCSAQERCEVLQATRLFGPGRLAEDEVRRRTRQRLFHALQAVHLRGETHITVRELRAALVYILFGVHYCRDYHIGNGDSGSTMWESYAERAFSPKSFARQGEVLRELVRFDPALDAHPQIDRLLLRTPSFDDGNDLPRYNRLPLEAARRRAWFEWPEAEIEDLTGDRHALDLARGRHLRKFLHLATDGDASQNQELAVRLCAGISRLQTLPPQALDRPGAVPLQITPRTPTETAFWVEKSAGDFRLEADIQGGDAGLERLHRQAFLIYHYRDGRKERLRLGAELFHLLLELSDGYQLGDVAADDTFAHLSIFVQRLVQEDHRRMLAWNPMREDTVFEISAEIHDPETVVRQRMAIVPIERPGELHGE